MAYNSHWRALFGLSGNGNSHRDTRNHALFLLLLQWRILLLDPVDIIFLRNAKGTHAFALNANPEIFSGLTVQTSQLDHQVRVWNQLPMQNIVDVISSLVRKRYMLRQARHCATMHILLVLSSTVGIKALVPWFYSWIMTLTSHISIWTVIAYLCFASRPMRGVFFTSMEQLLPFITAQQFADNRDDGEGEDALRPWDLTKTLVIEWPAPREKTNTLNVSIGYDAAYHEQQKAS